MFSGGIAIHSSDRQAQDDPVDVFVEVMDPSENLRRELDGQPEETPEEPSEAETPFPAPLPGKKARHNTKVARARRKKRAASPALVALLVVAALLVLAYGLHTAGLL